MLPDAIIFMVILLRLNSINADKNTFIMYTDIF